MGPTRLDKALQDLIGKLGIRARLQEYDAVQAWPEVVGAHIAGVTEAKSIRQGVLVVHAKHPVWRHELSLRKGELRDRLNERLGNAVVKDIRFV